MIVTAVLAVVVVPVDSLHRKFQLTNITIQMRVGFQFSFKKSWDRVEEKNINEEKIGNSFKTSKSQENSSNRSQVL